MYSFPDFCSFINHPFNFVTSVRLEHSQRFKTYIMPNLSVSMPHHSGDPCTVMLMVITQLYWLMSCMNDARHPPSCKVSLVYSDSPQGSLTSAHRLHTFLYSCLLLQLREGTPSPPPLYALCSCFLIRDAVS